MTRERLVADQRGRVLIVRFTNPPRNFFDVRMALELDALVRDVDRDTSLGAVVLTGQGMWITHFNVPDLLRGARSAPFEIAYPQARAYEALLRLAERSRVLERLLRRTSAGVPLTLHGVGRTMARMNASDKVYVAAINGLALGMGAILALQCDLRLIADRDDRAFGLIETGISLLAAAGGTQRLVRMVGQSRAAQLLLEGRALTPAETLGIGLVHRVVPEDELEAEALAVAERVAGRSPLLNREIKRMVYDAGAKPVATASHMESASMIATMSAPRAREEMEAYVAELAEHEPPEDGDILTIWDRMLASGDHAAPVAGRT